MNLQYCDKMIW